MTRFKSNAQRRAAMARMNGHGSSKPVRRPACPQPYKHNGFTLYRTEVDKAGGGKQSFYYFAGPGHQPAPGTHASLKPDGYDVRVASNGLPYLEKHD